MTTVAGAVDELQAVARRRFDLTISAGSAFFEANAREISSASFDMSHRFQRGGRLFVFGEGADATDAHHVAVEFVHPVIVGKRALPAIALTNDAASFTAPANSAAAEGPFAAMLEVLGRHGDIALGIGGNPNSTVEHALEKAQAIGMLTLSIERESPGRQLEGAVDHRFSLPGSDAMAAQEIGETLYHILWELVHIFLEHGVSDDRRVARGATSPAS